MAGRESLGFDFGPEIRNGNGAFLTLLPNGVKVTINQ